MDDIRSQSERKRDRVWQEILCNQCTIMSSLKFLISRANIGSYTEAFKQSEDLEKLLSGRYNETTYLLNHWEK